jgi:hypothetical protein
VTDDPALWLGTYDREFETLDGIRRAALAEGYDFMPLPTEIVAQLADDKAREIDRPSHDRILGEFLRRRRSG